MVEENKPAEKPEPVRQIILGEKESAMLDKITGGNTAKYARVAMAALSGIPWVGSIIGAAATLSAEKDQGDVNKVVYFWVKEHEEKLKELSKALSSIFERFESFGDRIDKRIQSEEYISLVRGTFWRWDHSETTEKKEMLRKLITNAGGVTIVRDDWVRMFLDWIEKYHELHFRVIAEIYRKPGITRREIWINIKGVIPTDSSAEADLFKLLIDDLAIGRVIRQEREINSEGQFMKKSPGQKGSSSKYVMESPFNDDPYVLTELGTGFVRYVMNELTPQIGAGQQDKT